MFEKNLKKEFQNMKQQTGSIVCFSDLDTIDI